MSSNTIKILVAAVAFYGFVHNNLISAMKMPARVEFEMVVIKKLSSQLQQYRALKNQSSPQRQEQQAQSFAELQCTLERAKYLIGVIINQNPATVCRYEQMLSAVIGVSQEERTQVFFAQLNEKILKTH